VDQVLGMVLVGQASGNGMALAGQVSGNGMDQVLGMLLVDQVLGMVLVLAIRRQFRSA
jgi:hypothetical protein